MKTQFTLRFSLLVVIMACAMACSKDKSSEQSRNEGQDCWSYSTQTEVKPLNAKVDIVSITIKDVVLPNKVGTPSAVFTLLVENKIPKVLCLSSDKPRFYVIEDDLMMRQKKTEGIITMEENILKYLVTEDNIMLKQAITEEVVLEKTDLEQLRLQWIAEDHIMMLLLKKKDQVALKHFITIRDEVL